MYPQNLALSIGACLLVAATASARQTPLRVGNQLAAARVPLISFVEIQSPLGLANHKFGTAVSLLDYNDDGLLDLAVGAPGESAARGAVYLYYGPNYGAGPHLQLTAADGAPGDEFGGFLAKAQIDGQGGEELVISAHHKKVVDATGAGAVYIMGFNGGVQKITASNPQVDAEFGSGLSTGDFDGSGVVDVVVGARLARRSPGDPTAGLVYLFEDTGSGLQERFLLTSLDQDPDDSNNSNFGARFAALHSGGTTLGLVISRMGAPVDSEADQGIVDYFAVPISAASIPLSFINPLQDEERDEFVRWGMWMDIMPRVGGGYRLAIGHPRQDRKRLRGPDAMSTGTVTMIEMQGTNTMSLQSFGTRDLLPEFEDGSLYGYRSVWADVLGSSTKDLVNLALSTSPTLSGGRFYLYDGDNLNNAPTILALPGSSSSHPADALVAGNLFPNSSRDEIVCGDARWQQNGQTPWVGRVLIAVPH
ncbi:MAG: FG-GAP repeat protein [bacterium]|jgi:hypothetical protein|nr:hypothetical protein [Planctomycetota bacterium]HIL53013.1 hypothetical protein [Planctomycetota bacterium]